jgi:hypothetical protein
LATAAGEGIATVEQIDKGQASRIVRLTQLAPDIVSLLIR